MPVLRDADGFALVVIFRSQIDTDNGTGDVVVALDGDLVLVRFMVQSLQVRLDLLHALLYLTMLYLTLLYLTLLRDSIEINVVVVEEGHERRDLNVLNGNA